MKLLNNDGSEFVAKCKRPGELVLLKGTSGTGKGTRVRQVLEFLKSKYKFEGLFIWDDKVRKNNLREFGLLFPELGIIFVGKYTVSNKSGLENWKSLDHIHRTILSVEKTVKLLEDALKNYSLVAEGNPMLGSFRYRIKSLQVNSGVSKYMCNYFFFNDKEEYYTRIVGRSGVKPRTDGAWLQNKAFEGQLRMEKEEQETCSLPSTVEHFSYAEPVEEFGVRLLHFFELPLEEEFREFCRTYSACRSVQA